MAAPNIYQVPRRRSFENGIVKIDSRWCVCVNYFCLHSLFTYHSLKFQLQKIHLPGLTWPPIDNSRRPPILLYQSVIIERRSTGHWTMINFWSHGWVPKNVENCFWTSVFSHSVVLMTRVALRALLDGTEWSHLIGGIFWGRLCSSSKFLQENLTLFW